MAKLENDDSGHAREGALAALTEVARDSEIVERFGAPTSAFEDEDYQQLIALAWRHQFDNDRTDFRRGLRDLQAHVTQRILDILELSK